MVLSQTLTPLTLGRPGMSQRSKTIAADTAADALADAVRRRVAERQRELEAQGRALDLGDVEDLAERMMAALPSVHPLDQPLGPFYDTSGLISWLGISRQAL